MKYCPAIDIEISPEGPIYKGAAWPIEILVDRGLADWPQGPHAQFGRRGSLQFFCSNGTASYRRLEDRPDGWLYVLVDKMLVGGAPPESAKPAPQPPVNENRYRLNNGDKIVEAFQWLPHVRPPVVLPVWFVGSDFEHNNQKGILTLRGTKGAPQRVEPTDWVLRDGDKIVSVSARLFAEQFSKAA